MGPSTFTVEQPVEALDVDIGKSQPGVDPDAVDEGVEFGNLARRRGDALGLAHVEPDRRTPEPLGRLLREFRRVVGRVDVEAVLGETLRDAVADTLARAGHQRVLRHRRSPSIVPVVRTVSADQATTRSALI
jgi:hypothetical protein